MTRLPVGEPDQTSIAEDDEAERCRTFLAGLAPDAPRDLAPD